MIHISHVPITISDSSGPHRFTNENALVSYCAEHNRQVEKEYEETFKIEPPYLLQPYIDYDGSIMFITEIVSLYLKICMSFLSLTKTFGILWKMLLFTNSLEGIAVNCLILR